MNRFYVVCLACLVVIAGCAKQSTSPENADNDDSNTHDPQQIITTQEAEPNNSADSCNLVTGGQAVLASIFSSNDVDWYKLRFDNRGSYEKIAITITNAAPALQASYTAYDSHLNSFGGHTASNSGADVSGYTVLNDTVILIAVRNNISGSGTYKIAITCMQANDQYEPNEIKTGAYNIGKLPWGQPLQGVLLDYREEDWYKYTVNNAGCYEVVGLIVDSCGPNLRVTVEVYDAAGVRRSGTSAANQGSSVTDWYTAQDSLFYIRVSCADTWGEGRYRLLLQNMQWCDQYEPNETIDQPTHIGAAPVVDLKGTLVSSAENDWYTFTCDSGQASVSLTRWSTAVRGAFDLYNSAREKVISKTANDFGSDVTESAGLAGGTYFLRIRFAQGSYPSNYTLNISQP